MRAGRSPRPRAWLARRNWIANRRIGGAKEWTPRYSFHGHHVCAYTALRPRLHSRVAGLPSSSAGRAPRPMHSFSHPPRPGRRRRPWWRECGRREAACARSPAHPVSDPSGAHRPCMRAREHSPPAKARATEGRPPWRLASRSTRRRTPRRRASGSTTTTGAGCLISSGPRRRGVSGHASSPFQTHHQP